MSDLESLIRRMVAHFEACSIPYAIMGGFAVRVHALPRPTNDIDFTIQLERQRLPEFFQHIDELGLVVPEPYLRGWVDEVAGMPIVKLRYYLQDGLGLDVDIFLAESDFQNSIIERRQLLELSDLRCWLVSPEDLLLLKLIASRPRDLIDIQDILFTQGTLDHDYLRHWAQQLGVEKRLEEALS